MRGLARTWAGRLALRAPELIVVAVAFAACIRMLLEPGMPYNVDLSGFFPLTPDAYGSRFWPAWNERGGMSTLQFLPALLFEGPLLFAGGLFGWEMPTHVKLRIVLVLALSGLGMLALARHYLRRHYRRDEVPAALVGALALAPALFYMLNPWAIHRIFHYFLWVGYALAPFVVLAFERLALKPSWRRALVLALVMALATTDPHNPPYLAILLVPLGVARVAAAFARGRGDAARLAGGTALATGAYALLSAYWMLPYAASALGNPAFGPTYVMSDQMIGTLSRNGSFLDTLRLLHNYFPRADATPASEALVGVWTAASFVVPLLALNAVILRPRATPVVYALVALTTIGFGMGTRAPWGEAYLAFVFDAPWGEGLSWLFRDPYRWGGAQAFAYAVLSSYALAEAVRLAPRLRGAAPRRSARLAPPAFALLAVALFVAPTVGGYFGEVFAPVQVPGDYPAANAALSRLDADAQVVWMPRMLGPTTWSGARTLEYFDATSSARAAIGPFRPHTSTYFDLLEDAARDGEQVGPLLARAGATHVVLHDDRAPVRDARFALRLEESGLVTAARAGTSPVEQARDGVLVHGATAATTIRLAGARVLSQDLVASGEDVGTLWVRVGRAGSVAPPLEASLVASDGRVLATREVALDEAWGAARFEGVRPEGERLSLQLRLADASSAGAYDVSMVLQGAAEDATMDAYPEGELRVSDDAGATWRALPADIVFERRVHERGFVTLHESPRDAPRLRASGERILSPAGLGVVRTLAKLPEGSALGEAPVLAAGGASRADVGSADARWVAPFEGSLLEAIAAFLPEETLAVPFRETSNADADARWARGTSEFVYEDWGWRLVAGERAWSGDDGRGLVYVRKTGASLDVPVDALDAPGRALLRVYEGPRGGALRVLAVDAAGTASAVGQVATSDAVAPGFRWVDAGPVPAGTTALRLVNDGGVQGVSLVATASEATLRAAEAAARGALSSVTLAQEAEDLSWVRGKAIDVPREGRFVRLGSSSEGAIELPFDGDYGAWLRVAGDAPLVTIDGMPAAERACEAPCGRGVRWVAYEFPQPLTAGRHTLRLEAGASTLLDALLVSDEDPTVPSVVPIEWSRSSATSYRARLAGPATVVLAVPYDAGWVARVEPSGERVRSILADGVVNAFPIGSDGPVEVTIRYEPHAYAHAGAVLSLATLLGFAMAFAWRPLRARVTRGASPSELPWKEESP